MVGSSYEKKIYHHNKLISTQEITVCQPSPCSNPPALYGADVATIQLPAAATQAGDSSAKKKPFAQAVNHHPGNGADVRLHGQVTPWTCTFLRLVQGSSRACAAKLLLLDSGRHPRKKSTCSKVREMLARTSETPSVKVYFYGTKNNNKKSKK